MPLSSVAIGSISGSAYGAQRRTTMWATPASRPRPEPVAEHAGGERTVLGQADVGVGEDGDEHGEDEHRQLGVATAGQAPGGDRRVAAGVGHDVAAHCCRSPPTARCTAWRAAAASPSSFGLGDGEASLRCVLSGPALSAACCAASDDWDESSAAPVPPEVLPASPGLFCLVLLAALVLGRLRRAARRRSGRPSPAPPTRRPCRGLHRRCSAAIVSRTWLRW